MPRQTEQLSSANEEHTGFSRLGSPGRDLGCSVEKDSNIALSEISLSTHSLWGCGVINYTEKLSLFRETDTQSMASCSQIKC